jgi:hypothetical protein
MDGFFGHVERQLDVLYHRKERIVGTCCRLTSRTSAVIGISQITRAS